jgi:hypothetical protein
VHYNKNTLWAKITKKINSRHTYSANNYWHLGYNLGKCKDKRECDPYNKETGVYLPILYKPASKLLIHRPP